LVASSAHSGAIAEESSTELITGRCHMPTTHGNVFECSTERAHWYMGLLVPHPPTRLHSLASEITRTPPTTSVK